jgi:large subunit ribosomal protein L4
MSVQIKRIDNNYQVTTEAGWSEVAEHEISWQAVFQTIRSERLSLRKGTAHAKTRGEVRGGGKKPWRQKGTGRARHGSMRSPIWVGGGVTHGPRKIRNWHRKINKSTRKSVLKFLLKQKMLEGSYYELEYDFRVEKTKRAAKLLEEKGFGKKVIMVYTSEELSVVKTFSNLPNTEIRNVQSLKLSELLAGSEVVLTSQASQVLYSRIKK